MHAGTREIVNPHARRAARTAHRDLRPATCDPRPAPRALRASRPAPRPAPAPRARDRATAYCATLCYMARSNPAVVGVRELRQNLSVYLDRVKKGEALTVTEHGTAVAILRPLSSAQTSWSVWWRKDARLRRRDPFVNCPDH